MGAFSEISVMANRIHLPNSIVVSTPCMLCARHVNSRTVGETSDVVMLDC